MANLIIKSSADNLVLQGSDASPAITVGATGTTTFAENATLSGTGNQITSLGTVTSGTLGSAVVFNDAHKDIDCDADSWLSIISTTYDQNDNGTMDFPSQVKLGSNVTESGGVHTVGTAGWYFVYCSLHNAGSTGDDTSARLYLNGSAVAQGRIYWETSDTYDGQTHIWVVEAAATNTFHMHGSGNWYGDTGSAAMSCFGGFRVGA